MAFFQWVGGHTGYTGPGSGFDIGSNLWISPTDGSITGGGDYEFGPYYWGNIQNWRYYPGSGTPPSAPSYDPITPVHSGFRSVPSRLPGGGDTVIFSDEYYYRNVSPNEIIWTGCVSCLYGGMSGDGLTSLGLTAWNSTFVFGGTAGPAGQTGTAPLRGLEEIIIRNFVDQRGINRNTFSVVESSPQSLPYQNRWGLRRLFDCGRIGIGANRDGDFDNFSPLRVIAKKITIGAAGYTAGYFTDPNSNLCVTGSQIAIQNLPNLIGSGLTHGPTLSINRATRQPRFAEDKPVDTTVFIRGFFNRVQQNSGNLFFEQVQPNPNVTGDVERKGEYKGNYVVPSKLNISNKTKFESISIEGLTSTIGWGNPYYGYPLLTDSYVHGCSGGTMAISVRLLSNGKDDLTIGSVEGDGSCPVISSLRIVSNDKLASPNNVELLGSAPRNYKLGACKIINSSLSTVPDQFYNEMGLFAGPRLGVSPQVTETDYITILNMELKDGYLHLQHPNDQLWHNFTLGGTSDSERGVKLYSSKTGLSTYYGATLQTVTPTGITN